MCLGHVYIVLEPVGSARLMFDDDLYHELCDLLTEVCLESRMRSRTWRGVLKWSRGKDSYIGRLYSDIGMVPSDSGIFRSTEELREFTGRSNGPYWALVERGEKGQEVVRASPLPKLNWTRGGGAAPLSFSLSPPSFSPTPTRERGNPTPGGSRTPPRARHGRSPTWTPSPSRIRPPPLFHSSTRGNRKERERERE